MIFVPARFRFDLGIVMRALVRPLDNSKARQRLQRREFNESDRDEIDGRRESEEETGDVRTALRTNVDHRSIDGFHSVDRR